jgi:hypothetical protein
MRLRIVATITDARNLHGIDNQLDESPPRRGRVMDRDTRNAAIAALWILLLFGIAAYYLPTVMLAAGKISTVLAGLVGVVFVLAFFLVFWLRGRNQRKKGD